MKQSKSYSKTLRRSGLYCYSTGLEREETAAFLFDCAKKSKQNKQSYWDKMRRYYDGEHDIRQTGLEFARRASLPWLASQSTDGYIHVETQIQPALPSFEFNPRDKSDVDKAKQREKIVKFIVDNNDLEYKNSRNERSLNIYGSAAYKVCWDSKARFGTDEGDVAVERADIRRIYTDPSARDVDSCEYIAYVYPMHRERAKRVFEADIESKGASFEDYLYEDSGFFDGSINSDSFDADGDCVTVTEWWFRQPSDGECRILRKEDGITTGRFYKWKAGDIALSLLINGKEVRYIPKYWTNTSYNSFPFVIYSKLPDENSIWGKSELEQIIPLIDAKDRELAFAQLNSAFSSNDIILAEENALCEGEELDNSPGTVWKLRPGMTGKVSRLGNMAAAQGGLYSNAGMWQSFIESTTGNFEVSQGKEPSNVTTATGIALLNERSESRKSLKNADRNAGFKRLFVLIDMTALENYNDGRIIKCGFGEDEGFVYSFGGFVRKTRQTRYIPSLDVSIHVGNAVSNSKAFTVSALSSLMHAKIDESNYEFVKAYLRAIDIPEGEQMCSYLDRMYGTKQDGAVQEDGVSDITHITDILDNTQISDITERI